MGTGNLPLTGFEHGSAADAAVDLIAAHDGETVSWAILAAVMRMTRKVREGKGIISKMIICTKTIPPPPGTICTGPGLTGLNHLPALRRHLAQANPASDILG